jgi:hypothetical protein
MSATDPVQPTAGKVTAWVGFIVFAGMLLVVSGVFTLAEALYALVDDAVFVQADGQTLLLDITTWGWVHLVMGLLQVIVGTALMRGAAWARVLTVIVVGLNATAQMVFLPAYPLWGLAVIALDLLVIWAVCMHGTEVRDV